RRTSRLAAHVSADVTRRWQDSASRPVCGQAAALLIPGGSINDGSVSVLVYPPSLRPPSLRHGVCGGALEMSGADSARLLFKRRLHHASLRTLVYDAVRRVSILDGDRVEIELDDPTMREHEHLLHAPVSHAPSTDHTLDEPGPVPALAIGILVVGSRGDVQPFLPIAQRLARDGQRSRLRPHAWCP